MASSESASGEVKEDLRKLFLKITDQQSAYQEILEQIQTNRAEMNRIKEVELQKISHYFMLLKRAIDDREHFLRKTYEDQVDDHFGYFEQELQNLTHAYSQVEVLYQNANSLCTSFDHSDHAGIVAAAYHVKNVDERYEELRKSVLGKYPVNSKEALSQMASTLRNQATLDGKSQKGEIGYFRGTRNPSTMMPAAVINTEASLQLISNIGHIAKSANYAKF